MPLILPQNPQIGQTLTEGSRSWIWTGVYWKATSTTIGYTGSRGRGVNFVGNLATESDLPLPYSGEENDAYVVEATGILWIWDGSSWGPVGQFTGYTGSRGVPGASVKLLGSVATEQDLPQNPEPGDGYIVQALGDLFVWNGTVWTNVGKITGEVGPIGFTGSKGDVGFTGSTGFVGSRGIDGNFGGVTLDYTFSADTDSSLDPGVGKIKFNDTVLTSASLMYIGDADDDNINLTSYLATIDASTSELKGHFRISRKGYPEQFVIFAVTDTTQNQGSYFIISCSYVSGGLSDSSTAFDDGDDILITFARTGDKGDTGFTGSQGLQGFTGSQGATGTSVRIVGSLADQSLLPDPYGGEIGDGYLVEDTGHLWLWNGTTWNDIGQLTGEVGPSGFTGSQGLGIIDTELVNDELIIIYDDSTQNNLGNIRGFQGSRGESSFFWGAEPPLNPEVGARWFYTTEGLLLVYTDDGDSQQWVEVAATGFLGQTGFTGSAGLSGVRIQSVTYVGQATAADTQGGETLGIVGGGFNAGVTVYVDSTECAATVVDQNNLTFVSPAKSAGVYDIVVHNSDGSSGIKPQSIEYSGAPVWTTQPSLPAQTVDASVSIILSATSNSAVTYFLQQGSSLPAGLSLSSSGVITGTVTGITEETEYTFTVVAIDAESQTTPRSFSLTVLVGVTVEYLVVAGGGGGANYGGGGAGGYRTAAGFSVTVETAYTVTVGAGGTGGSTGAANGSISVFSTISSAGGGRGGANSSPAAGAGGSGGGGNFGFVAGGAGNTPVVSPSQGNNGGSGGQGSPSFSAGGGGGAGAVGGDGVSGSPGGGGAGGNGLESSISGSATYYAGGGGGGVFSSPADAALGGLGGGGVGGKAGDNAGTGGTNLGGGGGGGGSTSTGTGGAGGSGVVILKYSNAFTLINAGGGLTFTTSTAVAGYKITTFTAGTGNIAFYRNSDVIEVEYLVIAGGGGAGNAANWNAGGGAGGYLTGTLTGINLSANLTTTVGAGGSRGAQGGSSVFSSVSTTGGGRGGEAATGANAPGGNGGSGGGGSANNYAGGNGISGQGFNGGTGASSNNGGGGGAGGLGGNAVGSTGGAGGAGAPSSITGTEVTRAVGGGGDAGGTNGTTNTGNGGNGAGGSAAGGSGGSGVVIIAYPDTYPAITTISGGLAYDQPTRAGYRVYRFTAGTGIITF